MHDPDSVTLRIDRPWNQGEPMIRVTKSPMTAPAIQETYEDAQALKAAYEHWVSLTPAERQRIAEERIKAERQRAANIETTVRDILTYLGGESCIGVIAILRLLAGHPDFQPEDGSSMLASAADWLEEQPC
ncbi:MAG TPA: hypothetical protein VM656_09120 [Pyrinomonadaceae bacterium]|nr:hypothetical protein [Pyrinomonadaceae bacterium]